MSFNNNNNLFTSLKQGLGILSERKNNIFSLKDKIKHSKDNIIEGFCETGTVDEKISCFKDEHKEKGLSYQRKMMDYSGNYRTFLENLNQAQMDVSSCKTDCYNHELWAITGEDYGDGNPDVETKAKFKTLAKRACTVGCHLHLPKIMDCDSKEVFKVAETTQSFGTIVINEGDTCNQIYEKIDVNKKVNTYQDNTGSNVRNKLQQILDASGNNAYDHCCLGKLGEKYKPYKLMNNKKYTSCDQFGLADNDPAKAQGVSARRTACDIGYNKFSSNTGNYDFIDIYS